MWRDNLDGEALGLCMILLCQLQDRRGRHPNTSGTTLSDVEIAHAKSEVPMHR